MAENLGNIIVHKLSLAREQIRDIIHLSIQVSSFLSFVLFQYKAFSLKNGFVNKFKPIFMFDLETGLA